MRTRERIQAHMAEAAGGYSTDTEIRTLRGIVEELLDERQARVECLTALRKEYQDGLGEAEQALDEFGSWQSWEDEAYAARFEGALEALDRALSKEVVQ